MNLNNDYFNAQIYPLPLLALLNWLLCLFYMISRVLYSFLAFRDDKTFHIYSPDDKSAICLRSPGFFQWQTFDNEYLCTMAVCFCWLLFLLDKRGDKVIKCTYF